MIGKKDRGMVSHMLMTSSVIAVALAGIGYMGTDIWLASTQWLLVAILMGLFGVYLKLDK